ncbi:MAG: 6-carboxytetrahydropterin synthase QueD [Desulfovibrionaceae bacterium]
MKKVWRLTVRSEFAAGHALRHYEGKCEHTHGHNFAVELVVEGDKLQGQTALLVDFKVLKAALKRVLDNLDHCVLNEKPPFDTLNPSSENLSRYIWEQLDQAIQALCVRLHSVSVSEKSAQSATYMEIAE